MIAQIFNDNFQNFDFVEQNFEKKTTFSENQPIESKIEKVFKNHKIKLDYCIDLGKEEEGINNLFSLSFIR